MLHFESNTLAAKSCHGALPPCIPPWLLQSQCRVMAITVPWIVLANKLPGSILK